MSITELLDSPSLIVKFSNLICCPKACIVIKQNIITNLVIIFFLTYNDMRIKLLKHEIGVKLRTILIKNALASTAKIKSF
jgi:hypothetical protein